MVDLYLPVKQEFKRSLQKPLVVVLGSLQNVINSKPEYLLSVEISVFSQDIRVTFLK